MLPASKVANPDSDASSSFRSTPSNWRSSVVIFPSADNSAWWMRRLHFFDQRRRSRFSSNPFARRMLAQANSRSLRRVGRSSVPRARWARSIAAGVPTQASHSLSVTASLQLADEQVGELHLRLRLQLD